MIIHLSAITLDIKILRFSGSDFEVFAGDNDVGGAGAAGPFLAVEAVAAVMGGEV